MLGLIKVGRTIDDPAERDDAARPSAGVETAFILAYKRFFSHGEAAERFVLAFLEGRGYRANTGGEFVRTPLEVVIQGILKAPGATEVIERGSAEGGIPVPDESDDFYSGLSVTDRPAWKEIW